MNLYIRDADNKLMTEKEMYEEIRPRITDDDLYVFLDNMTRSEIFEHFTKSFQEKLYRKATKFYVDSEYTDVPLDIALMGLRSGKLTWNDKPTD